MLSLANQSHVISEKKHKHDSEHDSDIKENKHINGDGEGDDNGGEDGPYERNGIIIDDDIAMNCQRLVMLRQWATDNNISNGAMDVLSQIDHVTITPLLNQAIERYEKKQKPALDVPVVGNVLPRDYGAVYPRYTQKRIAKLLSLEPSYIAYICCTGCFALHRPTNDEVFEVEKGDDGHDHPVSRKCGRVLIGDQKCPVVLYSHDDYIGSQSDVRPRRTRVPGTMILTPCRLYLYQPLRQQLQSLLKRSLFERCIDLWRDRDGNGDDTHGDVYTGNIYKTREDKNGGYYYRPCVRDQAPYRLPLSISINIDWYGIYDTASHYSAGTIYAIVDQLPVTMRHERQWIMALGALPGGSEKDINMNHLLQPIVEDLQVFYDGIMMPTHQYPQGRMIECILSCVICDSVAARRTIGFVQSGGNSGCHMCWATFGPRSSVSLDASDTKQATTMAAADPAVLVAPDSNRDGDDDDDDGYGEVDRDDGDEDGNDNGGGGLEGRRGGQRHRAPRVCISDLRHERVRDRTRDEHVHHGGVWHRASSYHERRLLTRSNGYMSSILLQLPYWIPSKHTPVDWLHVGPLGVAKTLFNRISVSWNPSIINRIQQRLDDLAPPRSLARASMTFKAVMKKMTGDMMITFVTCYSLYALHGILTKPQLYVWYRLVVIMRICTQYEITHAQLQRLRDIIREFYDSFAALFPTQSIPPNFHLLTHVPDCIQAYGAPCNIWTMHTERGNGWFQRVNNNRISPDEQLIRQYWVSQLLANAMYRYSGLLWTDDQFALMMTYRYVHDHSNTGDYHINTQHRDRYGPIRTRYISGREGNELRYYARIATHLTGEIMTINNPDDDIDHRHLPSSNVSVRLLNYLKHQQRLRTKDHQALVRAFHMVLYPRDRDRDRDRRSSASHDINDLIDISVSLKNRVAKRLLIGNDIITSELWRSWRESYVLIHRRAATDAGSRLHAGRVMKYMMVTATLTYRDPHHQNQHIIKHDVPHLLAHVKWFDLPVPAMPSLEDDLHASLPLSVAVSSSLPQRVGDRDIDGNSKYGKDSYDLHVGGDDDATYVQQTLHESLMNGVRIPQMDAIDGKRQAHAIGHGRMDMSLGEGFSADALHESHESSTPPHASSTSTAVPSMRAPLHVRSAAEGTIAAVGACESTTSGNVYSWTEWQPRNDDDLYHEWIPVYRLRRMMPANVQLSNGTAGFYALWLPSSYDHHY